MRLLEYLADIMIRVSATFAGLVVAGVIVAGLNWMHHGRITGSAQPDKSGTPDAEIRVVRAVEWRSRLKRYLAGVVLMIGLGLIVHRIQSLF